jgi:hypothetical protein
MKNLVNENLRDELIDKVINTVYKNNDPKYNKLNRKYLESLSIHKLDKILDDHYIESKRKS